MTDFFSMGGYGFYVWSSYIIFFSIISYVLIINLMKLNEKKKKLINLEKQSDQSS